MSTSTLNSLLKSIEEADGILRGKVANYESWSVTPQRRARNSSALAVFVGKDEDFVTGKIYDVRILPDGGIVATSETGEAVMLEHSDFLIVKFQPKAEKLIRRIVSA